MTTIQLNFFDNLPLSNARNLFEALEFEQALEHYSEALKNGNNQSEIEAEINACNFWKDRIATTVNNQSLEVCKQLLKDYKEFDFSSCPAVLKRKLLVPISQKFCMEEDADLEHILQLFDLLLKYEHYDTAATLIEHYLKIYESDFQLYYYYAQALYLDGYYDKANAIYVNALILQPDINLLSRIENPIFRECIQQFGMPFAPAYSLIKGVKSNVDLDLEFNLDPHQAKSFSAYQLILQAERSTGYDAELREKIQKFSPELLAEYLKLQDRRTRK